MADTGADLVRVVAIVVIAVVGIIAYSSLSKGSGPGRLGYDPANFLIPVIVGSVLAVAFLV